MDAVCNLIKVDIMFNDSYMLKPSKDMWGAISFFVGQPELQLIYHSKCTCSGIIPQWPWHTFKCHM